MLIASTLALAGLLLWAAITNGPLPPAALVRLRGNMLEAEVGPSIYGRPTAILFTVTEPQAKSGGRFETMLPDVQWHSANSVTILNTEYPVMWAAADPNPWESLGLTTPFAMTQSGEGATASYSIKAGPLSEIETVSLSNSKLTCLVMLDSDMLIKAHFEVEQLAAGLEPAL
jgi:hypothetical protein